MEAATDRVRSLLAEQRPSATSPLTYVECLAAFARAEREGRLASRDASIAVRALDRWWEDVIVIELDHPVMRAAGALARRHALRTGDAIHLASAEAYAAGSPDRVTVACWDSWLRDAAEEAGFALVPESADQSSR